MATTTRSILTGDRLTGMKRIEITAEPREQITVNLVGVEYLMTPPKGSLGLDLAKRAKELEGSGDVAAIWGEVEAWLKVAAGKKQFAKIQERLSDADDDLDIIHIIRVMEAMVEAVTDTPTSSSSD